MIESDSKCRNWLDRVTPRFTDQLTVDYDSDHMPLRAAVFDADRAYRYALAQVWNPDRPPAVFIMLNPSTADALVLDPTVTRCKKFADRWGLGGYVVLNAFAFRSTDPKALRTHPDPVGPHNNEMIANVLTAEHGPVIVAWGCDETLRRSGRDRFIVELLHAGGIEPVCLGQTKDGFPRHPLYVRGNTTPTPYPDADAYAKAHNRLVS